MVLLLDLGRGLACLWVVLFHLREFFRDSAPLLHDFAALGMYGLPIFFVISGYVITKSAESSRSKRRSPWQFLKNRFRRIYPTFWFSVVFIVATPFVLEGVSALRSGHYTPPMDSLPPYDVWQWLDLLLLTKVFQASSYDLYAEFAAINAVYWTLAVELQFYLVMFLALFLGRGYRWMIGLITLLALLLMFNPARLNWGLFIHYWLPFATGVGIAYLERAGIAFRSSAPAVRYGCSALFLLACGVFYYYLPVHQYAKSTLVGFLFGLFLWFCAGLEDWLQAIKTGDNRIGRALLEPWLLLGVMSYSIYLLHLKAYLYPLMLLRQIAEPDGIGFALALILGTLALCYPAYYFVERRFLSANYHKIHEQILSPAEKGTKPEQTSQIAGY